ncbi:MAG: DNA polymerase III subunit delta [Betaproteobacteria bacterium]
MQLRGDALGGLLAKADRGQPLPSVFVVASDEPLLALEAQDAIRATARRQGYTEREVLQADGRFDWSRLTEAAGGLSLFADRKIVEIRLPGGKPGTAGAAALEAHAAQAGEGLLTIVALPKLDRRGKEARWVAALERAGVLVEIDSIDRARLPQWIGERLARQQQRAGAEALEFIAERVEGNLLAAHQEIAKLGLLHPPGELTLAQVTDSVLNVARYDVFQLPLAMLGGDAARVRKTVAGLEAEGEAIPLVLWAITEELRTLIRVKAQVQGGRPFSLAARDNRVWGPRERLVERLLPRLSLPALADCLARAARIDRLAKGLRAPGSDSDAWLELADLALSVAATSAAPAATR